MTVATPLTGSGGPSDWCAQAVLPTPSFVPDG
jgi:hypothetical protein